MKYKLILSPVISCFRGFEHVLPLHPIMKTSPLVFLVFLAMSVAAIGAELKEENLYRVDHLLNIEFELPPEEWKKLCEQTRDFEASMGGNSESPFSYFKADITIDGVRIESVGIRKKGFIGSLDNKFPSLKVKLDEYVKQRPIKGIDVLTLNNNKQDQPLVSQLLTYQLFNDSGVYASRVSFAKVSVNGEYLGIYSNVETLGKPFLKRRFGNNSGNLYEGTLADFYPKAVDRLEAKTNEKNHDRSRAIQLSELLASDSDLSIEKVEQLIDLDNFLKFWALESLVKSWDGYTNNQNNYWVYENPSNGKFYFIPWGSDGTFAEQRGPFGFGAAPTSVYTQSMLANRLYNTPGIAERYRQTMQQILATSWNEESLTKRVDEAEVLLTPHLHSRQSEAPRAMKNVRKFIETRRAAIDKEFSRWPVQAAKQPRKPQYIVDLGTAKGTFVTKWQTKEVTKPVSSNTADFDLFLEGKKVMIEEVTVAAQMAKPPRSPFGFSPPPAKPEDTKKPGETQNQTDLKEFERPQVTSFDAGPFGRRMLPATITFSGYRESDDEKVTITLNIDPTVFVESAGKVIDIRGSLSEGDSNAFGPFGGRQLSGTLSLSKVGMSEGDDVVGEFSMRITEMHGGFFDRRNGNPPGGNSPPAGPAIENDQKGPSKSGVNP